MSLLGNIWVKLGLKSEDFNTGMSSAEKRAERFGSFLGKVSARVVLGWAAIGAAIAKVTRASIQNYQTQEAANIKLQNALRNTGAAIGTNYEELKDYASQLQKVNGYADDATMSAMATLTTFRSVQGKVFKDTIAAAQDMATFLGTDLNSAVLQLGKALEAPETGITMLRRSGVIFTTEMTENIKRLTKEGKNYEAQLLILEEVNKRFGGEAARQADTAAGAWKRVGMAFGDLTEHIGKASNASKGLATSLASSIEMADAIISSEALTRWEKFSTIVLGINQSKVVQKMNDYAYASKETAANAAKYAEDVVKGLDSIEKAQQRLKVEQAGLSKATDEQRKADHKAAIEAIKGQIDALNQKKAAEEEAAKKAAEEAKKRAEEQKRWREEHTGILNQLKDEIADKQKLLNMATSTAEIDKINKEIKALEAKRKLLLGEIDLSGPNLNLNTLSDSQAAKLVGLDDETLSNELDAVIAATDDFLADWEQRKAQAEDIAEGFGEALRQGIISSLDELAEAIGTGNWDTTAMIKALVTPIADMAITAGTIILSSGEAVEALKKAFASLNGQAAVIAGAALIFVGTAAKAGLAKLAQGGGGKSAAGNSYTYTGGYGVAPQNTNVGRMEIAVTGVLKGQDIYLSGENYKKGLTR